MLLEQDGYEVEPATKFADWQAKADKSTLPDIIILDVLLSEEDGPKIAKGLKADAKTKNIPLIMISALPGGEDIAKQAGADAFLAKPFDATELIRKIEQCRT
jgi:two-component system alkaline phosphatase synthesis response regulator PhoP/two-component system response regulator MprA